MSAVTNAMRAALCCLAPDVPILSMTITAEGGQTYTSNLGGATVAKCQVALDLLDADEQGNHSPDYRWCRWCGKDYRFSPLQAACVKVLWTALREGRAVLSQAEILGQAGSCCDRLIFLFRDRQRKPHPAWGTMIVSEGRGMFRLSVPTPNARIPRGAPAHA